MDRCVGVVAFILLPEIALSGHDIGGGYVARFYLFRKLLAEPAFGLLNGWGTLLLLKSVDNYQVEVLLTLGLVTREATLWRKRFILRGLLPLS